MTTVQDLRAALLKAAQEPIKVRKACDPHKRARVFKNRKAYSRKQRVETYK